jgi:hypothetical protein
MNLSALEDTLSETRDGIIRGVFPTQREHINRCIAAGLLEGVRGERGAWRLTSTGTSVLAMRRARASTGFAGHRSQYLDRDLLVQTMGFAVASGALSATEAVVFSRCWDHPSTIPEALEALGVPRVFADALQPGVFTVGAAPETFTLHQLLTAHSARMMPADLTAVASLAHGEAHEIRTASLIVRRVGNPPRESCSRLGRRLSNILALYGKVLHAP